MSFHVFVSYLYVFYRKMSIQIFSAFFHWVVWVFLILSCMSCLYIWDINPLLAILFANKFTHSVGCLFILSMISFAVQKCLSLIRSHLFIIVFISFALGDGSKKILLWFMSKSFLPMVPLSQWLPGTYLWLNKLGLLLVASRENTQLWCARGCLSKRLL